MYLVPEAPQSRVELEYRRVGTRFRRTAYRPWPRGRARMLILENLPHKVRDSDGCSRLQSLQRDTQT
eukprot:3927096-Prymnesium_polylepis.1